MQLCGVGARCGAGCASAAGASPPLKAVATAVPAAPAPVKKRRRGMLSSAMASSPCRTHDLRRRILMFDASAAARAVVTRDRGRRRQARAAELSELAGALASGLQRLAAVFLARYAMPKRELSMTALASSTATSAVTQASGHSHISNVSPVASDFIFFPSKRWIVAIQRVGATSTRAIE